jgi:hypothetical protein
MLTKEDKKHIAILIFIGVLLIAGLIFNFIIWRNDDPNPNPIIDHSEIRE